MLFINSICPICNLHTLGSQSKSRKQKKLFKTCGSKDCQIKLRSSNHSKGAKFSRKIEEYQGTGLCECGRPAKYIFKSGKLSCQSVASNCPIIRKDANKNIAEQLKNTVDSSGMTLTQKRAYKGASTKRMDIDQEGNDGFKRFSDKLKKTIESSKDSLGRTYLSRSKISEEEFLAKPERDRYYQSVWEITSRQFKTYFNLIPDAAKRGNEYHLDHIFSISEGFRKNVPPEIIGHVSNLRIISAFENNSKNSKCHKTLTALYEDYNNFKG